MKYAKKKILNYTPTIRKYTFNQTKGEQATPQTVRVEQFNLLFFKNYHKELSG